MTIKEFIIENKPLDVQIEFLEGYDDAIIGVGIQSVNKVAYSLKKCTEIKMQKDGIENFDNAYLTFVIDVAKIYYTEEKSLSMPFFVLDFIPTK
jgi:hypothetical protein